MAEFNKLKLSKVIIKEKSLKEPPLFQTMISISFWLLQNHFLYKVNLTQIKSYKSIHVKSIQTKADSCTSKPNELKLGGYTA